jgi:hypothetical protein
MMIGTSDPMPAEFHYERLAFRLRYPWRFRLLRILGWL